MAKRTKKSKKLRKYIAELENVIAQLRLKLKEQEDVR
jgi:hypothetical protein